MERRTPRRSVAWGAGGTDAELAARLHLMDAAGVEVQVLSASPQLPHFDDEAHAICAARFANDLYAEIVRRHPERFVAFAPLPLSQSSSVPSTSLAWWA
jgi:6-methylsalicylate decarboxylase